MKQRPSIAHTRRKQLDRALAPLVPLLNITRPERGWIHAIRSALGMSADALAQRLGIKRATALRFEKSEQVKTISLKTLERVAEALGCKLIYVLLPEESLERILRNQARKAAEKIVARVQHSMRLEAQGGSDIERTDQIEEIAEELARTLSVELWKGI